MDVLALRSRPVPLAGPVARSVRGLYREAFPPAERVPLALLHANALRPHCRFLAWFEADSDSPEAPCALTYTYETSGLLFLGFFAVDSSRRGRGTGSRILAELDRRYADRPHVLEIEPVDENAANVDQRRHRLAFYQRNGFVLAPMRTHQAGETYRVLTRGGQVAPSEFQRLLDRQSLGLYRTRVEVDEA